LQTQPVLRLAIKQVTPLGGDGKAGGLTDASAVSSKLNTSARIWAVSGLVTAMSSARTPSTTLSRLRAPKPGTRTPGASNTPSRTAPVIRFIDGEPMKPATNIFTG
jgi:hypothetical protein